MTTMRLESAERRASKEGYTYQLLFFIRGQHLAISLFFCISGPLYCQRPCKQQEWAVLY